jgi:hypothetical protein
VKNEGRYRPNEKQADVPGQPDVSVLLHFHPLKSVCVEEGPVAHHRGCTGREVGDPVRGSARYPHSLRQSRIQSLFLAILWTSHFPRGRLCWYKSLPIRPR